MWTKSRTVPFWGMVGLASTLLLLALPSLAARLLLLPGDETRLALLDGTKVDPADLDRLEGSRKSTLGWFAPSSVAGDMVVVSLERAQAAPADKKDAFFAEAEKWQRVGLAAAPADTYGWFRLAFLLLRAHGPSIQAAQAWKMSLATAPYEPRLSLARLKMAMQLGSFLDEDARQHIPVLIRELAVTEPEALAKAAYNGAFTSVVEEALVNDEEPLKHFRGWIAAMSPPATAPDAAKE